MCCRVARFLVYFVLRCASHTYIVRRQILRIHNLFYGIELRKHYPQLLISAKKYYLSPFLMVIDGVPEVSRASGDPPPFKLPLTGNGEN